MRHNKKKVFRPLDFLLLTVIVVMSAVLLFSYLRPGPEKPAMPVPEIGYMVTMPVPAVDSYGKGIVTNLIVETKKGSGKTLANIDVLLFWVDTQQSIQTARTVAKEMTNTDTSSIDIIYSIDVGNVSLVGGPSAGAALTIATMAALQAKQPNTDVIITGTIEEDGSIGEVGGVLEKARAAKASGAEIFLVPPGESTETLTVPLETCKKDTGFVYCETTYEKHTVNIGEEVGLAVQEVSDITEALPYFFQ